MSSVARLKNRFYSNSLPERGKISLATVVLQIALQKMLADLSAEPNPVDFGEVVVSTFKTIQVTLTNRGTAVVHLHELEITEDNREDFSIDLPDELVFPHAIQPGNQVVFSVIYHP